MALTCSQCGRAVPADAEELHRWRHGDLVLAGDVDEGIAAMLLCPDCEREDREEAYEEGGGD